MTETKTVTRETVEVQTNKETLYVCANCEQAFEDDETVTVAVDVDEDGMYSSQKRLCQQCADTLLGGVESRSVEIGPVEMETSLVGDSGWMWRWFVFPAVVIAFWWALPFSILGGQWDWSDPDDAYGLGVFAGLLWATMILLGAGVVTGVL